MAEKNYVRLVNMKGQFIPAEYAKMAVSGNLKMKWKKRGLSWQWGEI